MKQPTLNEVLSELGYTTAPKPGLAQNGKYILHNDEVVFSGTAHQVWNWLHDTNQI